jgi:PAS domain S-box-containing protein
MSEKKKTEKIDLNLDDIAVVFVGKNEIVVDINQKGCMLLELQKDEVVGENWFDVFVPQSIREEARLSFHQLFEGTSRKGHAERRVLASNGLERIVSWHTLPVKDENGEFTGAILSGQDVTDHKLAQERYVRLASFPAFDPNPIVEVDFDGNITYTNPATKKVFPNLAEKGLNQPFFSDWKKISATFRDKISMENSFGREISFGEHWYLQQFSFMPIGPRIRIYAVNIDEKKKAEQALKESEEKYRSLFENMINGYAYCEMIFNAKGEPTDFIYLEINDAFEKLTGLKREAVVGRKVSEAIPGTKEANPEIFEIYGRVATTGKTETFEVYFKPLTIWLNISVYGPKKGYFVAIFETITKRKELEAELNSYNKRLEEVVARRTAEYAQANKKLTKEIMERKKIEEGLQFRATILDNLSEAICLTNLTGAFVYANLAACELFGHSCDEFLAMDFFYVLQLEEAEKKAMMDNLLRTGQIELRVVHVRKDKVNVPIQLRLSIVQMAHGKFVICVIHKTA